MAAITLEEFSVLTEQIYESVFDEALWPTTMRRIKSAFNVSHGAFGFYDGEARTNTMIYGDCGPEHTAIFYELGVRNLLLPPMVDAPQGAVFQDQQLIEAEAFRRTDLYNEFFAPLGDHSVAVCKIQASGDNGGYFVLNRGGRQEKFSGADEGMMRLLSPTLIRAGSLMRRLGEVRLRRRAAAYDAVSIGFVVVDGSGRILERNATAERFFGEPERGLSAPFGVLTATDAGRQARLAAMIGMACAGVGAAWHRGGDLATVSPHDGGLQLALSIAPLREGAVIGLPVVRSAIVLIQDLTSAVAPGFEARVRALFGLSLREAALAAALASGKSLKAAAQTNIISMATARTQLRQLFRKTNTSQQSQLVALLRGIAPLPDYGAEAQNGANHPFG